MAFRQVPSVRLAPIIILLEDRLDTIDNTFFIIRLIIQYAIRSGEAGERERERDLLIS